MSLAIPQAELLGGLLSFLFTVALLSYIFGDNPVYRLALHTFIGVSIGYVSLVVIYEVLIPRLITPLLARPVTVNSLVVVPLFLFIFLVLKLNPRLSPLGNISVAFLLGVGIALAIGGAVTGTLFPQIEATWLSVLPDSRGVFLDNIIIVIGTVATLLYFQFWMRENKRRGTPERSMPVRLISEIGQGFVVITLGTIYGGMILSSIAIMSDRIAGITGWIGSLIP